MYKRIIAFLLAFGFATTTAVAVPAISEVSVAQAIGETVSVTRNSTSGVSVKGMSNSGRTVTFGVLPGGSITFSGRLDSWILPRGKCAMISVNGVYTQVRCADNWSASIWIPSGSRVSINIWNK